MKKLIRNYNYALSTSKASSLIIIKGPKIKRKTGMCRTHLSPCWLQTAARCRPSFVLRGQRNGFSYDKLVSILSQSYCKPSCVSFRNLCARAHTHTHSRLRGDCSGGSIFSHVNLDPHLPPRAPISTNSSGSVSPARTPKLEPNSRPVHSLL